MRWIWKAFLMSCLKQTKTKKILMGVSQGSIAISISLTAANLSPFFPAEANKQAK